jgi:hypothetical protein
MNRKEWLQMSREQQKIYSGILFQNQTFAPGSDATICYEMDAPEFSLLREKYDLETIAGKGGDFARAKRLMHYLAPRLTHSSWYDNHVPCNALALLEYSLHNPQQGINCLNKAKILAECCLALGIFARRVSIMPYSPYDFDNHVVTEIYDRKMQKWIMLDPSTDGYFVDEAKIPLSLLEMRHRFAHDEFITFVTATDRLADLPKSAQKNAYYNSYFCKNLFYFKTGTRNGFGPSDTWLTFAPEHFSVKETSVGNARFRCNHLPAELSHLQDEMQARLQRALAVSEPNKTAISVLQAAPEGGHR